MALSDIFYKVEGGVITKYNLRRGRIPWMGEESEDFAYQDKGYYTEVLINPTPTSTQKNSGVTYTVDEQNRTVIKEYHIINKEIDELLVLKIGELKQEANKRRDTIFTPEDYMVKFMKAIKTLNKKSKNSASQEEVDEIDMWEAMAVSIENINSAADTMITNVSELTNLQDIINYPVETNTEWEV